MKNILTMPLSMGIFILCLSGVSFASGSSVAVQSPQVFSGPAGETRQPDTSCFPSFQGASLTDPEIRPGSSRKISGAVDWETLARSIAMRVEDTLLARDGRCRAIFVSAPGNSPFERTFHELLRTALVCRGLQVADVQEMGALTLEYEALVVHPVYSGNVSAFDLGVPAEQLARRQPAQEVLINARLVDENRFAMHLSAVRIVDNDSGVLYRSAEDQSGLIGAGKRIRVRAR